MSTNKFSTRSLERLEGVFPQLVDLCFALLHYQDITVVYGKRTIQEQLKLFNEGFSKTMDSRHLVQEDGRAWAVDIAPFPIDWNDSKRFYYMAGMMMVLSTKYLPEGYSLRWGGNWDMDEDLSDQIFMDLAHFEIVTL